MARGGTRPNAGRKAGAHNKASIERQRKVEASGMTPLDYLLEVMRDEDAPRDDRLDAAKAAAPYVHPKLSSVVHKGDKDNPVAVQMIRRVVVDPRNPDA